MMINDEKVRKNNSLLRIHIFPKHGATTFKDLIDKNIFVKKEVKYSIKKADRLIYYIYTNDGLKYKVSKNIFDYVKITDVGNGN